MPLWFKVFLIIFASFYIVIEIQFMIAKRFKNIIALIKKNSVKHLYFVLQLKNMKSLIQLVGDLIFFQKSLLKGTVEFFLIQVGLLLPVMQL